MFLAQSAWSVVPTTQAERVYLWYPDLPQMAQLQITRMAGKQKKKRKLLKEKKNPQQMEMKQQQDDSISDELNIADVVINVDSERDNVLPLD